MSDPGAGNGILVEQPLYRLAVQHGLLEDLRHIFGSHAGAEHLLGKRYDDGPLLTEPMTAGGLHRHLVLQAAPVDLLLERLPYPLGTEGTAAGAAADGHDLRLGIEPGGELLLPPIERFDRLARLHRSGPYPADSAASIDRSICSTRSGVTFPEYTPSATTTGDKAQAPRQAAVSKENMKFSPVSPSARPR